MRKLLAVGLMAALFAVSLHGSAHAGGNELMYNQLQNLTTLAPTAVNPATDYEAVYQSSSGKVKKVLARGASGIVPASPLTTTQVLDSTFCGKTLTMSNAGVLANYTVPAATGTGCRMTFVVIAVNTSNYVLKTAGSDKFKGGIVFASDNASNAELGFETGSSGAVNISLNGTTTGGQAVGDYVTVEDLGTNLWVIRGQVTESGSEATPFS